MKNMETSVRIIRDQPRSKYRYVLNMCLQQYSYISQFRHTCNLCQLQDRNELPTPLAIQGIKSATTVYIPSLYCHLAEHRNHRSPTHSLLGFILWPAATSVNCVYAIKITIIFGSQVHQLLVFFHMCPTNQPIINGMALCHKMLEAHDINKCLKIKVLILCLASQVLNSTLLLVANVAIFLISDEV